MLSGSKIRFAITILAAFASMSPLSADALGPTPSASVVGGRAPDVQLEQTVALELARLDERLDLGTFPDASGLWPARLAAAIEYRLHDPDAPGAVAPRLLARLADGLRALGTERGLLEVPEVPGRRTADVEPIGPKRIEHLQRVLEIVRRLHVSLEGHGDLAVHGAVVAPAGGITGTVTRQDTGAPVSGAAVTLYDTGGYSLDEVVAGADGSYRFDDLDELNYLVRASGTGLIGEAFDGASCPFSLGNCATMPTPVHVSGGVVSGVDMALATGGTLSGVVTDASTGDPVDAFVHLYSAAGTQLDGMYTGVDGTYEFDGAPAGSYFLRVSAQGYLGEFYDDIPCPTSCSATSGTSVTVIEGTATSGIDFALDPLGAITGTVTQEATGDPIPMPVASVFQGAALWVTTVVGLEDGTYRLDNLQPGDYLVEAAGDGYQTEVFDDIPCPTGCDDRSIGQAVTVLLDQTTSGIDFSLDRLGTIAGTVTDAVTHAPIPSSTVRAVYGLHGMLSTTTGADGSYELSVPPVAVNLKTMTALPYRDEAWDDVPCYGSCDPSIGTPLDVPLESAASGIDFALDRFGSITGTAISSVSGAGVQGQAYAFDEQGSYVASGISLLNGFYEVPGLETGRYYVQYSPFYIAPDTGFEAELFANVPCDPFCDVSPGTLLDVALNAPAAQADFVLAPCPAASYNDVVSTTFTDTETEEACEQLTAGSSTTIATGADVTFKAGRSIVLGDGFKVESGASFRAVIEPSWTSDQ